MTLSSSHKALTEKSGQGLDSWLSELARPFLTSISITASFLIAVGLPLRVQAADSVEPERYALISDKAVSSLLLDISRLPASERLVAVGDRGHILYSDDSGENWTQARVPTIQMLTAVTFPSARIGFAAGHDNLILKTEDAGVNWHKVYQDIAQESPLLDIWFKDESYGIAVGAYGTVLRTRDGGKGWSDIRDQIENEEEFHFNAISSDNSGNVYLAGEAGILYRSTNAGHTWETLASPYEGSLFGVSASADEVLIHGLRGNVFRSMDRGASWMQMNSRTEETLFGSAILGNGSSYLVGNSGSVLAGNSGRWQTSYRQDRMTLTALAQAPDGAIVVVGQGGIKRINDTADIAIINKIARFE